MTRSRLQCVLSPTPGFRRLKHNVVLAPRYALFTHLLLCTSNKHEQGRPPYQWLVDICDVHALPSVNVCSPQLIPHFSALSRRYLAHLVVDCQVRCCKIACWLDNLRAKHFTVMRHLLSRHACLQIDLYVDATSRSISLFHHMSSSTRTPSVCRRKLRIHVRQAGFSGISRAHGGWNEDVDCRKKESSEAGSEAGADIC